MQFTLFCLIFKKPNQITVPILFNLMEKSRDSSLVHFFEDWAKQTF